MKTFHQLVILERGPVNTALIDLLKQEIYQVENAVIDKFNAGEHDEIKDYIKAFEGAELIIEVDRGDWLPDFEVVETLEKARKKWESVRDKPGKCRTCELKYICFDCMDIPFDLGDDFEAVRVGCKQG